MLAACHERVERMLALMVRLQRHLIDQGRDDAARQAARDVIRYFDLAAPLHHEDEELHVFPPLMAGPDPGLRALAARLVLDHRAMEAAWPEARSVLDAVAGSPAADWVSLTSAQTEALEHFVSLYGRHLMDEDKLAYPAARAVLAGEALQAMSRDMMQRRGVPAAN